MMCSWKSWNNFKFIRDTPIFLVALPRFYWIVLSSLKKLNFESFLPLKRTLVATLNENRAATSRKYVAEQRVIMANPLKTFQSFWLQSSIFAVVKFLESLNFWSIFTSKRTFGGHFQWNMCTLSWKMCNWTRYSNAKSTVDSSIVLVALFRFCFRKSA